MAPIVPCSLNFFIQTFFLFGVAPIGYTLRSFILFFKLELVNERMLSLSNTNDTNLKSYNVEYMHHKFLAQVSLVYLFCLSLAMVWNIMGNDLRFCHIGSSLPIIYSLSFIVFLTFISFSFLIRKGLDAFGIRQEFLIVGAIFLMYYFLMIAGSVFIIDRDYNFVSSILTLLTCAACALVSSWHPLLQSFAEMSRKRRPYFKEMIRNGSHPATGETTSPKIENPRTIFGKEEFIIMLSDEEGYLLFQDFLVGEYSVENLLLWEDISRLEDMEDNHVEQIVILGAAFAIWQQFISRDAQLQVNISHQTKKGLSRIFESPKMKDLVKQSQSVNWNSTSELFDPSEDSLLDSKSVELMMDIMLNAKKEIEQLMYQDSFSRFKFSREYLIFRKHLQDKIDLTLRRTSVMEEIDRQYE